MPKHKPPKLCKLKVGKHLYAVVYINAKPRYLGIWASSEAKAAYARFEAEWWDNHRRSPGERVAPALHPPETKADATVLELCEAFLDYALVTLDKQNYKHHKFTVEDFLLKLYAGVPVDSFKARDLKLVRSEMIRALDKKGKPRFCRKMVNDYTRRIVAIFSWGVSEDMVQPSTVAALREVKGLRKGEQGTRDNPPRKKVSDNVIRRTLPFMSPTVRTMVLILRLTGMRPSELCRMTVEDIEQTRGNGLWYYTMKTHKTEQTYGEKVIPLGAPEQALLAPYLKDKEPSAAVFSPQTAMQEWYAERRANRKTPMTPSQKKREEQRAENPRSRAKEFYDRNSFRKAILNAINKGNKELPEGQKIPHWFPYQIRHATSTAIEIAEGLDASSGLRSRAEP